MVSHIKDHWEKEHEGRETEFQFKFLSQSRSSFHKEVSEAVLIKSLGHNPKVDLLNSKEEFNRCIIPELTVLQGRRVIIEGDQEAEKRQMEDRKKKRKTEKTGRKPKKAKLTSLSTPKDSSILSIPKVQMLMPTASGGQ